MELTEDIKIIKEINKWTKIAYSDNKVLILKSKTTPVNEIFDCQWWTFYNGNTLHLFINKQYCHTAS